MEKITTKDEERVLIPPEKDNMGTRQDAENKALLDVKKHAFEIISLCGI